MNYRSEIAELSRFFGTYISLIKKYQKASFKAVVDVGDKILEPFSDKTYSLLHRDISVIDVDYELFAIENVKFKIYMKTRSGKALYIYINEGHIGVFAVNKQENNIMNILYMDAYLFKGIFRFFLNYDLLYNIASPRTKEVLQRIYNSMTGGIK